MRKTLEQRFWEKVHKTDGCWEWTGAKKVDGYGRIAVNRKATGAHRVSWGLHFGPIPKGMWVLHHCDNPPCTRPDHLYLGTIIENSLDRKVRGRVPNFKGEMNPNAKLNTADVVKIRASTRSISEIAKEFNMGESQIGAIRNGEYWND